MSRKLPGSLFLSSGPVKAAPQNTLTQKRVGFRLETSVGPQILRENVSEQNFRLELAEPFEEVSQSDQYR